MNRRGVVQVLPMIIITYLLVGIIYAFIFTGVGQIEGDVTFKQQLIYVFFWFPILIKEGFIQLSGFFGGLF